MADLSASTLLDLADRKLADAKVLCEAGSYGNAYYLAGYSVELALKAVIATKFVAGVLPDPDFVRKELYTHDLSKLLVKAGLKATFDSVSEDRPALLAKWKVVALWSETARYDIGNEEKTIDLIEAIGNSEDGVLSWVKQQL